jgi:hypothetical protein
MTTVTGLTADRMLAIEAESIVDGDISGNDLILTRKDGVQINAGNVRGPAGPTVRLVRIFQFSLPQPCSTSGS